MSNVHRCVCVFLSPSSRSKIGWDFGESTARNITASSGKLHLTQSVYVCACRHTSKYNLLTVLFLRTGDIFTSGKLFFSNF